MNTAARNGELRMVKMLVEAGADPNGTPNNPPLVSAAYRGRFRVVEYLLAQPKIEVNKHDIDGLTALWAAAKNGSAGMVDMLLKAGADRSLKNERGETPEDKARQSIDKFEGVIKRLERTTEQDGADQPATAFESESEAQLEPSP